MIKTEVRVIKDKGQDKFVIKKETRASNEATYECFTLDEWAKPKWAHKEPFCKFDFYHLLTTGAVPTFLVQNVYFNIYEHGFVVTQTHYKEIQHGKGRNEIKNFRKEAYVYDYNGKCFDVPEDEKITGAVVESVICGKDSRKFKGKLKNKVKKAPKEKI